jgi:hypothetical protein
MAARLSRNERIQPRIQALDRQNAKTGSFRKCHRAISTGQLGLNTSTIQLVVAIRTLFSEIPLCTARLWVWVMDMRLPAKIVGKNMGAK